MRVGPSTPSARDVAAGRRRSRSATTRGLAEAERLRSRGRCCAARPCSSAAISPKSLQERHLLLDGLEHAGRCCRGSPARCARGSRRRPSTRRSWRLRATCSASVAAIAASQHGRGAGDRMRASLGGQRLGGIRHGASRRAMALSRTRSSREGRPRRRAASSSSEPLLDAAGVGDEDARARGRAPSGTSSTCAHARAAKRRVLHERDLPGELGEQRGRCARARRRGRSTRRGTSRSPGAAPG